MTPVGARIALLSALLLACTVEVPPPAGDPAPDFDLQRLDGGRVSLDDLKGKTVLLDFWATWCPPCVLEVPELNAFYAEYRDRGVEVLAISIDDDEPAQLAEWVARKEVQYPVAIGTLEVARLFGAEQFPFHLLISPDGRVLERLTPGYHDREELAALVSRHLEP